MTIVAILGGGCAHVVSPDGAAEVRPRHAYGRRLEQLLDVVVVNASSPGCDATGARKRFERTIRPRSPAALVVHLDRPAPASAQLLEAEAARIVRLARYDKALVLLLPIAGDDAASERLAHLAAGTGDPDVRFVDPAGGAELGDDGRHLSIARHQAVAEVLAAEIARWIGPSGALDVPT